MAEGHRGSEERGGLMGAWYPLPFDEGIPKYAPRCADGDELEARVGDEVLTVTVCRRRGCAFLDESGEPVEPDAIREVSP